MQVASTDGVTVALHDLGGSGEPLLIVHATGFCAGAYAPLATQLTARFHVWGIDCRGHGDTPLPAGVPMTWPGTADDVLTAVDAIGGPVTGFGHSMGGTSLLLAETKSPGTLRAAGMFEPIVMPPGFAPATLENPLAAGARKRRAEFGSRAEAIERFASRPPLNVFRADSLHAYVAAGLRDDDHGTVSLKCTPEVEASTYEAGKITVEEVAAVDVPLWIANGTRDGEIGPAAFAPVVAATLPRAELHTYERLGHFGPFQDPDVIAGDLLTWLAN